MRPELKFLNRACNESIYPFICFTEWAELLAKFSGSVSLLNLYFTCERFKVVNVLGTFVFLNSKKFHIKNFLVGLLKKGNKEFACP